MKKITLSFLVLSALIISSQLSAQNAENVTEYNHNPNNGNVETPITGTNHQVQGGIIYSNGPVFNTPGGGAGGADLSLLENLTVGNTTLGAGIQTLSANRMSDDWVVTETVEVTSIDFYAYQTGSTTTSTMTGVTLQIWDGIPNDPASQVIYGDDAISAMTGTTWSGIYRASETTPQDNARPIMTNTVATPGLILTPGTYWLDWDADGTLASGPWAPPIALLGPGPVGNAIQYIGTNAAWQDSIDGGSGNPLGFPFDVTGSVLGLNDNILDGFTFYPNPVRDILNVRAATTIENISIYNVLGQELIYVSPDALSSKINIANLSNGMYIMKATVNGVVGSFNVVKR
ncbi:MAG: hypothetical protein COZ75_13210 [Flavobacteriaceae bacterium CG_4_8_14_3_um_filter_34_10]|nr:MAG: hypothetical protein AUK33_03235 [Flavobacteriaceae bacterium CG2_30_34_30]PIQ17013.1 MAG: hypothetical protein COW66_13655 [Flavobacteriaceae bacterium CG18_big_fil_WC_8_21_14_2_50_34_36]PIX08191.1 MAG: hypothetical protein COZ75_13210 [Flavobacteriaceae bacterium CG_4_8_14_3_um_filter_34_10]PIZ07341.1 MAG: hypothetical protein COY56_09555 [Flavobacteriaceae bacterium CG_4_10_14_0_8_um_filter_34_31]